MTTKEIQYGWITDMDGNKILPLIAKEGYFSLTKKDIERFKRQLKKLHRELGTIDTFVTGVEKAK